MCGVERMEGVLIMAANTKASPRMDMSISGALQTQFMHGDNSFRNRVVFIFCMIIYGSNVVFVGIVHYQLSNIPAIAKG